MKVRHLDRVAVIAATKRNEIPTVEGVEVEMPRAEINADMMRPGEGGTVQEKKGVITLGNRDPPPTLALTLLPLWIDELLSAN